jgi:hypothetical protein
MEVNNISQNNNELNTYNLNNQYSNQTVSKYILNIILYSLSALLNYKIIQKIFKLMKYSHFLIIKIVKKIYL